MSKETIERCDICDRDTRSLSFKGGTYVYRGRFKQGGWFWKGREDDAPEGEIAICQGCWSELGRVVREARESRAA